VHVPRLRGCPLTGRAVSQDFLGSPARGPEEREPDRYRERVHLKRVIPCLDVDGGRVVKGVEFVDIRDAGDPVELAAHYDREGADELVFLDITATHERRETIVELARRTADEVFVPFTIGGGIRSVQDAQAVLDAGADKVSVNSAALARPELIDELARVFGAQCVVLAVDAKAQVRPAPTNGASATSGAGADLGLEATWEAYVAGGRTATGRDVVEWAREATARGAGEILLTSMDRDGTSDGYDLRLTAAVSEAVGVPVIASGGAGELTHLAEALHAGADAALCASIFHYGQHTVGEAKEYLERAGVPVRR
jgi:cyclase